MQRKKGKDKKKGLNYVIGDFGSAQILVYLFISSHYTPSSCFFKDGLGVFVSETKIIKKSS